MFRIDRQLLHHFDWSLFSLTLIIPLFGLIVLYSAGYDPDSSGDLFGWLPFTFASATCARQIIFLSAGLIVMIVGMIIPSNQWQRWAYGVYSLGICSLTAVLLFGVVVNGSRRWLSLGPVNIQPAELMKLGVIMVLAAYLSKHPPRRGEGYSFSELLVPGFLILLPMALIGRQPDLGTAIAVGLVGTAMLLFVGIRKKTLVIFGLSALIMIYPAWHMLHDYQQRRIMVLLDPEVDPQGSGYHIIQSKIAVGSGALTGKGFLKGTQTQLEFLPEHSTDFVFSVLAEEWGFAGSVLILALFFMLVATMLRIAKRSRDLFGCLVVFGITALTFGHVIINSGMVLGLMPVVGIPLPLVSYGGSSLLTFMFALGIVQGISMRRTTFSQKG